MNLLQKKKHGIKINYNQFTVLIILLEIKILNFFNIINQQEITRSINLSVIALTL